MKIFLFIVLIFSQSIFAQDKQGGGIVWEPPKENPDAKIDIPKEDLTNIILSISVIHSSFKRIWKECTKSEYTAKNLSEIYLNMQMLKKNRPTLFKKSCEKCDKKYDKKINCLLKDNSIKEKNIEMFRYLLKNEYFKAYLQNTFSYDDQMTADFYNFYQTIIDESNL